MSEEIAKQTEEHRVLAQQQAEERTIAEKRAAGKQKAAF